MLALLNSIILFNLSMHVKKNKMVYVYVIRLKTALTYHGELQITVYHFHNIYIRILTILLMHLSIECPTPYTLDKVRQM